MIYSEEAGVPCVPVPASKKLEAGKAAPQKNLVHNPPWLQIKTSIDQEKE